MEINRTEQRNINALSFSIGTFSLWFVYNYFVINPNEDMISQFFSDYSNNLLGSPYRYRVLITDFVLFVAHQFNLNNLIIIYRVLMLLIFSFSMFQLLSFINKAVSRADLFWCNVYVAQVFLMISFSYHFYQPWSFLDIGLYSFFYSQLLSFRKKAILIYVFFTLAILNRETGIFIAALLLIQSFIFKEGRWTKFGNLLLFMYGVGLLLALRVWKGYELISDTSRVLDIFKENIRPFNLLIYCIILVSSGLIWLVGVKHFDVRLKAAYVSLILFLPLYFLFGIWIEIRMLLPFLPILILPVSEKLVESFSGSKF